MARIRTEVGTSLDVEVTVAVWTVIESFAKTAVDSEKEVSAVWRSP
jgi:hypothetical protein